MNFVYNVVDLLLTCCLILDPVTKEWLNINCDPVFGYPSIVRFGWSTCQNKLDSKAYEVRWLVIDSTKCISIAAIIM